MCGCRPRRRTHRPGCSVRPLPDSGADLQLLRSRPDLLRGKAVRRRRGATPNARPGGATRPAAAGGVRHAARARRYRARQKNVTHQGSPPPPADDLVLVEPAAIASDAPSRPRRCSEAIAGRSDWPATGAAVAARPFVRREFLRRRRFEVALGQTSRGDSMTIPPELEAQILRYYHVEKWPVGTIARQLRRAPRHGDAGAGPGRAAAADRPHRRVARRSIRICPSSAQTLETVPDADRQPALRDGARARLPRRRRPLPPPHRLHTGRGPAAEAYLRLRTLPGEQAQVDWGHFGHLTIGRARAPADGLRHGAELVAPDLPALLPRCPHGELPARPCRRPSRPGTACRGCCSTTT